MIAKIEKFALFHAYPSNLPNWKFWDFHSNAAFDILRVGEVDVSLHVQLDSARYILRNF
jgi:hypothetical protein